MQRVKRRSKVGIIYWRCHCRSKHAKLIHRCRLHSFDLSLPPAVRRGDCLLIVLARAPRWTPYSRRCSVVVFLISHGYSKTDEVKSHTSSDCNAGGWLLALNNRPRATDRSSSSR